MDEYQAIVSLDRLQRVVVLAYLLANLTRWTTHFTAFVRLLMVQDAITLAVMSKKTAIIAAEVGVATGAKGRELMADAEYWISVVKDGMFWETLEHVVGDLEPICYATNIGQKDSTRVDTILLSLVGIFLHFAAHPVKEVATSLSKRVEKRWKDCDQPLYLLTLVLNPFEQLSRFGDKAGLNRFKWKDMLLQVSRSAPFVIDHLFNTIISKLYRRIHARPSNSDSEVVRRVKEKQLTDAFLHYLAGTGNFAEWTTDRKAWTGTDPIQVWEAFETDEISELCEFAKTLLRIVPNQAGCERLFSDIGNTQGTRRTRTGLEKLEKMTKVCVIS